jgi:hypothetical protein
MLKHLNDHALARRVIENKTLMLHLAGGVVCLCKTLHWQGKPLPPPILSG